MLNCEQSPSSLYSNSNYDSLHLLDDVSGPGGDGDSEGLGSRRGSFISEDPYWNLDITSCIKVDYKVSDNRKRKADASPGDSESPNPSPTNVQNNDQDHGSPSDRRKRRRKGPPEDLSPLYACPYFKTNPGEYPKCAKWYAHEIHRVKYESTFTKISSHLGRPDLNCQL